MPEVSMVAYGSSAGRLHIALPQPASDDPGLVSGLERLEDLGFDSPSVGHLVPVLARPGAYRCQVLLRAGPVAAG